MAIIQKRAYEQDVHYSCFAAAKTNNIKQVKVAFLMLIITPLTVIAESKLLSPNQDADLVFRNGTVYTVDASRSWASSVAVIDNRIEYVGNDTDIEAFIGPDTQIIDLDGRMLLPGFQDSHVHPRLGAREDTRILSLDGISDMESVKARIVEYSNANPHLTWIEGGGLDEHKFLAAIKNPRKFLDALVSDRPLVIKSSLLFTSWANSKALEVSGITPKTQPPRGGSIVHDSETGEPTGTFFNRAANLLYKHRPEPSREEMINDYRYALSKFGANGVTAIMDAGAGSLNPEFYTAYGDLVRSHELKQRVRLCLGHTSDADGDRQLIRDFVLIREKIQAQFPKEEIRVDCVKLYLDGDALVHGGALLEDYADQPGVRGQPYIEYERLEKLVINIENAGFQVKAHSIGSRSARELIDAVEAAQTQAKKPRDLRHHLSHAEIVHSFEIERMRRLGMPVEVTAMVPLPPIGSEFPRVLGRERATTLAHRYNTFIQSGLTMAFGSDWSGSYGTLSLLTNIEVAVTRRLPGDISTDTGSYGIINEHERISLPEAIEAYTIMGAYLTHDEKERGSIEVGKLADLVVLDKNLFEVPVHTIHTVNVDMTIFNGEVVYKRK